MSGDCAGLLLDWACQRTCARELWGRETPQRTAPGEALVSRQRTRVRFPPPPPLMGTSRCSLTTKGPTVKVGPFVVRSIAIAGFDPSVRRRAATKPTTVGAPRVVSQLVLLREPSTTGPTSSVEAGATVLASDEMSLPRARR